MTSCQRCGSSRPEGMEKKHSMKAQHFLVSPNIANHVWAADALYADPSYSSKASTYVLYWPEVFKKPGGMKRYHLKAWKACCLLHASQLNSPKKKKKTKKQRPATSTQTGQEQFEQMSSVPLASEIWDTLLKPEAKQDLGVVHSKGKRGEEGHFETVTRSRDAEFDAWSLCDKTSGGFASEVAQGEVSLPEPAPSFYVPWCKRTTL